MVQEMFGPAAIVIEYQDNAELLSLARAMGPSLTATIHAERDDPAADDLCWRRLIWSAG